MLPEWKEYEFQVIDYHKDKYNDDVWHMDIVPEVHLEYSGFIHKYNKHRLTRLAKNKEINNPLCMKIKYQDYGMDFLILDKNNIYHAGQAKHYTSRKVSASDIGTFYDVLINNLKTTGYLYTSSDLAINLKENIKNGNSIIHNKVPYKTNEIEVKLEKEYKLRIYQIEAILTMKLYRKNALEIFTGGGKTLIAGNHLKKLKSKVIICIAPLRISVDQLKNRISPFIPNYEVLLVDCDADGTTNIDDIIDFINNNNKVIIYSTFKSAEELLANIVFDDDTFILVDEVHNVINKEKLCDFINQFDRSLILSATIPEELQDVINIHNVYKYNISNGIKNKFCADYNIYLPYIIKETKTVDVDIPSEFDELDKDLCGKALFLATGILLLGKRRIIAYFVNTDECDNFNKIIKKVFKKYHGIEIWCEKIDCYVSQKKRKELLNEFEKPDYDIIKIITSVRILDEAVDTVSCDGQFIANVNDDYIRTVQRLGRGIRLDKTNPSKVNTMFLWCNEWKDIVQGLTLLKDIDINFNKKIHVINANYDKTDDEETKSNINVQIGELTDYIEVKCLTPNERWELRVLEWIEFLEINKRYPNKRAKIKDASSYAASRSQKISKANFSESEYSNIKKQKLINERRIGRWQDKMRIKKTYLMLNYKNRYDRLNNIKNWIWDVKPFNRNLDLWDKFMKKYKTYPSVGNKKEIIIDKEDKSIIVKDEKSLARWQFRMRTNYNNNLLSIEKINYLESLDNWAWNDFNGSLILWKEFIKTHNRLPKYNVKNKYENKIGGWQHSIRQSEINNKLEEYKINILNDTSLWKWGKKRESFDESFIEWKELIKNKINLKGDNAVLSRKSKNKLERNAATWQRNIGRKYINNQLDINLIILLDNTHGWSWKK
jgi:superfamily II DNA or RNA helicase